MKEFDAHEIEQRGSQQELKTGFCPILKGNCHGPLCMWWVTALSGKRQQMQSCAVTLIAIGMNDEIRRRTTEQAQVR